MTTALGAAMFQLEVRGDGVALLTFDQPESRANTLGQAALTELERRVAELSARTDLRGLIFRSGKPGMFIAGADLRELATIPPDPPVVRALVQRGHALIAAIEALPYPTVALIDGACMGGGLELALGFDFRLAGSHPKVEIGLPEVKVGLIPGWGGTQRLSRIIGPPLAAELICAGESVNAQRARALGLVFDVVPSDRLVDEATRLIEWAWHSQAHVQARARKRLPVGLTEDQHSFAFAVVHGQIMARTRGQLPAPLAALNAIAQGCNLPLEEGLKVEADAFVPLVGSPIARNLIAVFFMTQRLQKDPGVADPTVQPKKVERVGVLGAGIMGAGIAGAHVRRGIPVIMMDNNPTALAKGVAAVVGVLQSRISAGKATQADLLAAMSRLSTTTLLTPMGDRDVVIEAVVENEQVKTQLFRELQPILRPDAVLASNTSTISITRMAEAVAHPENFAGMHFFNPVDRMPLVEVIRGAKTSDQTVATLVALAKAIGKTPIVVRDSPGFLVNRILFPYMNEALALLEEGADPRAIDQAAMAFGMPMGPIALYDVVGLDTALYAAHVVNQAFADRAKTTRILQELVAAGRLGQKSGAGFYHYAKGSRGSDDPALAGFLQKVRVGSRSPAAEEMTDRLFLPMLTEATRVLAEGIVRDPTDVDMGLILGIGFPAFRGGLLRWADALGWSAVLQKLQRYEHLGPRFAPTEMMRQLAATGTSLFPAKG
ncbi:MAG: 3-hydroxyacyl-CoA dehydrogenase NAD-binding domain-containing protein [Gemmataceae bacterium]|nr:3-hydroxyacyl-CoA dehydrogenase NAD-binding domain-containing protein [Gemmataceae bacterium]MDW8266367.1 3-hydroxyacyl-CoA dehydrogenase NAD-binding domain-containing protein [Gemmataceae bacterium]